MNLIPQTKRQTKVLLITIITILILLFFAIFLQDQFKSKHFESEVNKIFYGHFSDKEIEQIKSQNVTAKNLLILAMTYTRGFPDPNPHEKEGEFWTELCTFFVENTGICKKKVLFKAKVEEDVKYDLFQKRQMYIKSIDKIISGTNPDLSVFINSLVNNTLTVDDWNQYAISDTDNMKCYYMHLAARNKNKVIASQLLSEIQKYQSRKPSCYNQLINLNSFFGTYSKEYSQTIKLANNI